MLLSLQKGIIYGPVDSRRYGASLGINLMPVDYKLCSFNCVYCHYGLTSVCTMDVEKYGEDLPHIGDVINALEAALRKQGELNLITFSGNGEPTIYPQFPELVGAVVRLRDKYKPSARVALLSNTTGARYKQVRESIARIDLPVLKLDAGTPGTFRAVNRPARGVRFDEIIENLASLENIYIQTVLVGGTPSNVGEDELAAYFDLLGKIRPKEVHMYSIDRPVPNTHISLIGPERLEAIALRGTKQSGVPIRPFCARRSP
jgi:wyosine [tRNA(Phe)-imidazoG37] synthetase (radical SAM superfamily)